MYMPSCHLSYRFVTLVSLDHVEGLRMGHNKEKVDICLFALGQPQTGSKVICEV